jgi:phosphoribosylanthranilate isomerase
MSLFVKICGVTDAEAVAAAGEAGADAVGFVFYEPSPRNLAPKQARALAEAAPPELLKVAVTRAPTQSLVDDVLAEFAPDSWQSDADDFAALRLPARVDRLPVFRKDARPLPELIHFEGASSGAGARADWALAAQLARRTRLILAGGLTPANVAEAIAKVRPYGVDVSSGVERAPGVKDPQSIFEFVRAARKAASELA